MSDNQQNGYSISTISNIFGIELARNTFINAEEEGLIPSASRIGIQKRRVWSIADLPKIGERYGYLKKPDKSVVCSVFATKGGILKSTISLNLARTAALHGIKTLIIGLDMQCDITHALGYDAGINEDDSLDEANEKLDSLIGLEDFNSGVIKTIDEIIVHTEIPTLSFIPETYGLLKLEKDIATKDYKELWLKDKVIKPLRSRYDLIILDCPPNWNNLISNALVASDILISPLECKINHYRNFQNFRTLIGNFREVAKLDFTHLFLPTNYSPSRRLRKEIKNWYSSNVVGCLTSSIRESVHGEEAMVKSLSLPEHAPNLLVSDEMRETIKEIWSHVLKVGSSLSENLQTSKKRTSKINRQETSI